MSTFIGGFQQPGRGGGVSIGGFTEVSSSVPKYIVEGGVRKINPQYQNVHPTTLHDASKTLPIVCNEEEFQSLQEATATVGQEVMQSESYMSSLAIMEEEDIYGEVGLSPEGMKAAVNHILAKYEVPMGLINRLLGLQEFGMMRHIIDDSSSMGIRSRKTGETRWKEAFGGIIEDFGILAHVPLPKVVISFLNRPDSIVIVNERREGEVFPSTSTVIERTGKTPEAFLIELYRALDKQFAKPPSGSTPAKEVLEMSLAEDGPMVARYLHCDGRPNGGRFAVKGIAELLKGRENPQLSPVTLIACSENDDDVKWMGDVEEEAPYCGAMDDFLAEREEVLKDQGEVFPYTEGLYRICRIIGSMHPDDLDALDDSAPLTKGALENILGYTLSEGDYRRYFDGIKEAQDRLNPQTEIEKVRKIFSWEPHYNEFLYGMQRKDITAYREYQEQLERGRPPGYSS